MTHERRDNQAKRKKPDGAIAAKTDKSLNFALFPDADATMLRRFLVPSGYLNTLAGVPTEYPRLTTTLTV